MLNPIYNSIIKLEETLPQAVIKTVSRSFTLSQFLFSHSVDARLEKYLWSQAILPGIAEKTKVKVARVTLYILLNVLLLPLYALYRIGTAYIQRQAEERKQAADTKELWNQEHSILVIIPPEMRSEICKRLSASALATLSASSRQLNREIKRDFSSRIFLQQAKTIFLKNGYGIAPAPLAQALAEHEDIEGALQVANKFQNAGPAYQESIAAIARELTKQNRITRAQALIQHIHNFYKISAEIEIIKSHVLNNNLIDAATVVNNHDKLQRALVTALAEKQDFARAKIEALLITTSAYYRNLAKTDIAKMQAQNNLLVDAEKMLQEVVLEVDQIIFPNYKIEILIAMAETRYMMHQREAARALLASAQSIYESSPGNSVDTLHWISKIQRTYGDHTAAKDTLEQAKQLASRYPNQNDNSRACALCTIAIEESAQGMHLEAIRTIETIDKKYKIEILRAIDGVIEEQCAQNNIAAAKTTAELLLFLKNYDKIDVWTHQINALGHIRKAEPKNGNPVAVETSSQAIRSLLQQGKDEIARTDVYYYDAKRTLDTWALPNLFIAAAKGLA